MPNGTNIAVPSTLPWKSTFNYPELAACGEGVLLELQGLPKLPRGHMLVFDRIDEAQPSGGKYELGFIQASFRLSPGLWFFHDHFKDDPIMPGCLGIDALWQLAGFFLVLHGAKGKGRAIGSGEIKFGEEILPEHRVVTYRVDVKRLVRGSDKRPWFVVADGHVDRDGVIAYLATDLKVGVFPKQ